MKPKLHDHLFFDDDRVIARDIQIEHVTFDRSFVLRDCSGHFSLTVAQRACVMQLENMLNGRSDPAKRCMFLLGGPGTGKSLVSRFLMQEMKEQCVAMAPTGIAATVLNWVKVKHYCAKEIFFYIFQILV